MIRSVGNNAGVTVQHSTGGGFTLEKIGFAGDAVRYSGQIGLLLSDTLRPSGLNEGWPTLRDVLFSGFSTGCLVGNTYQTGYMHNVFFQNSVQIGYQNKSTDWYHYGVYGGNGSNVASIAQLILGNTSGIMPYSAGYHQFHGGAWFGGNDAVIIANTSGNKFVGCDIQNGNQNGVLLTGTYANDNRLRPVTSAGTMVPAAHATPKACHSMTFISVTVAERTRLSETDLPMQAWSADASRPVFSLRPIRISR